MDPSAKRKCRQYSVEYLSYGFIPAPQNPSMALCLNCMKTFSNEGMRPSKMKKHIDSAHQDKKDKPLEYYQNLRNNFERRMTLPRMVTERSKKLDKGIVASYEVSRLIAKTGNCHNIGESLILPALTTIMSALTTINAGEVLQSVPLSNSTVSRRIDEMAEDIEEQLVRLLRSRNFSLQLDETLLQDNDALLMAYARFRDGTEMTEEMLFARRIRTDVTGQSIFDETKCYLSEKDTPLENITACATDGAACMVGRYRGFIAHLKRAVPTVFTVHCIIHREHLVSKNLGGRLQQTLSQVIHAVNYIKSRPHQDRLFHQLCEENGEEFKTLLMHTEVRWLSKGNCLQRFVSLWESVVAFLPSTETKKMLSAKVDIFYLADIFQKLNSLNLALQGRRSNVVDGKEAIVSFLQKLEVYRHNIGRREFLQFPNLKKVEDALKDDDLTLYQSHLKQLRSDMEVRFKDLLDLVIPGWVLNPFEVEPTQVAVEIQESLIDLRNDIAAGCQFRQLGRNIWTKTDLPDRFPTLWQRAEKFFIAFPSTYLVECGFSRVVSLTKSRNRIDIATRGDLRLSLSNLEPDIPKLAEKHQPQGSH